MDADLAIMNKRTLSDEEYLKLYQEKFGKLTESAKKQVLDLYHHTITEEEWKDIVDALMQFKNWEPSNEINSEGLDMDAFTEEEKEYLNNYEKKYHKLTEEEKEEIIKERRRKLGKRI
jgi:hypothetical protein